MNYSTVYSTFSGDWRFHVSDAALGVTPLYPVARVCVYGGGVTPAVTVFFQLLGIFSSAYGVWSACLCRCVTLAYICSCAVASLVALETTLISTPQTTSRPNANRMGQSGVRPTAVDISGVPFNTT